MLFAWPSSEFEPSEKWITAAEVITCGEDGEVKEVLINIMVSHGLWVLRDGHEALVTWDGIERWLNEM